MPGHNPMPICDLHCDTALRLAEGCRLEDNQGHLSLPKMTAGWVGLQVFACWVSPKYRHQQAWLRTQELIAAINREIARHPRELMLVMDRDSWRECRRKGRIGILMAVEGGHALGDGVGRLEQLYDQGVRMLTLTWNNSNCFASSAHRAEKSGHDSGLTPLGRKLIDRCDQLGIRLDLSHSSELTFWQVLESARNPPLLSHSCVKFLNRHFRNASDRQIRALAQGGGLLGINFCPAFLGLQRPRVSLESVADQFEYVKELVGTDVLAIGSDYDGIRETPPGLEGPDKLPALLEALAGRGFSPKQIVDISCRNVLRYLGWQ